MITKRQMGIGIALLGLLAAAGLVAVDLLGAGQFSGVGRLQRLGFMAAAIAFLVGLSLIPLGNRPA